MVGKLTVKTVQSLVKNNPGRHADGNGLYLVVPKSGQASWMLRFTSNKKRREMTLGKVADTALADARLEAANKMKLHREGTDPLLQRQRAQQENIKTLVKRLKFPQIPKRIYTKDIAPHIGSIKLEQITARDIRTTITAINNSGRPTIANDALGHCKQFLIMALNLIC